MSVDLATIGIAYDTSGLVKGTAALKENERQAGRTADAADKTGASAKRAGEGFSSWSNALRGLGLAAAITQSIRTADALNGVTSRLSLVTKSTAELTQVQRQLLQLSQENRADFAATADLYTSLARSTKDLGVTQEQLLKITGTFGKALVVSNASVQASQAAITQFNQAMSSGVLRGEEFNSINEQAPRIMDLLATSLGKTRGELRQLAQDGKLTSDVVLPAILKGAQGVQAEFAQMPITVAQAAQVFKNSLGQAVLAIDGATGSTSTLAGAVLDLSTIIDTLTLAATNSNRETGRTSVIQEGLATVFETVAVLGANVGFVLRGVGNELGAIAAQVGAVLRGDFTQAAEIGRLAKADAEAARAQIDATTANILRAREQAQSIKDAAGITDAQSRRMAGLTDTIKGNTKATGDNAKAIKAANKEIAEQAKLLAELAGLSPDYLQDLTRLQSIRAKGNLTEAQYVALVEQLIAKQPASIALAKEQADADKERVQALEQLFEANRKVAAEYEKNTDALADQNGALRNEIELIGLTEREQLNVIRLRTEATIAVKELELAELQRASSLSGTQTRIEIALEEEIRLLRERNSLQGIKVDRTDAAKAYEGLEAEGKRFTEDLERGLTDSLFRAFESGKGFFSTLWDGIKNLFKTTVLKLAIQGVAGGVTSGLANAAQAASGGSGVLSTVSSLAGLGALGSSFAGSIGSGLALTLGEGFAGTIAAVEAGFTAVASGSATAAAAGFGQIAGALGPYALAAVALYQLLKSKGGPKTESGFASSDFSSFGFSDASGSSLVFQQQAGIENSKNAKAIVDAIRAQYEGTVKALGGIAQQLDAVAFVSIDTKGDALTQLQIAASVGGQTVYDRRASGQFEDVGRTEEELNAAVQQAANRAVLAALAASDIPQKIKDYLGANVGSADLQGLINVAIQVRQLDAALLQFGGSLADVADLSIETELAFANLFGGLENLGTALTGYYNNFYTEAERHNKAAESVQMALRSLNESGAFRDTAAEFDALASSASREAFRDLIEAQDTSTDAGRATVAALLQLSSAFANVTTVASVTSVAIEDTAAAQAEAARLAAQIAQERLGLEGQLLQLQGDTTELRARELAALDPSNRALQEQIFALQDMQAATVAATEATREAEAQAQRVAQEREGLERRLLELNGDTQAIRQLELAALDASNRGLLENIFALQDQAVATQEAAQQAQAAADAARQIAQERDGLERQLLQLQGDSAALRAIERGALDESNRALFDQIQALQAQQAAAEAAAQSLRQASDLQQAILREREGLEGRLLQLQGDTNALRERELAALNPANQALLAQIFALEDQRTAAEAAAQATTQAAAAQAQAEQDALAVQRQVAEQREGLERRLLELTGNTAAIRQLELAALDPGNRALLERVFALTDEAAAADLARQAQEQAAAAAEAIAQQRFGLEGRILELQGDTAALRERELLALDPANRELQRRIFALTDEAAAAQIANQAIEEAQARAREIAQERFGLEGRLLELQGNTAALRERELQALDPANRAILAQIFALQDQATAANAAAQATDAQTQAQRDAQDAAQRIADERVGLERQLLEARGDSAALLALDRAAINELNRGLFDQIQAARQATVAEAELAANRERITQERAGLESRLIDLQGDTAAIRARELSALDASNRSILERIYALQDEQVAQAEAQRIAQQRLGLEGQLLQLQGDTAELRARELAALDPTNQALQANIYALQDQAEAAQLAAQAEQELANERQRIQQERYGLETQLLQLQGNTVALRARELALLDPSNQALQQQIFLLQDRQAAEQQAAQAASDATAAADRFADALLSASESIMDEINRLRGIDSGSTSLSGLQAQFAILTAQASAGSIDALTKLPEFSKAIEQATLRSAGSIVEVERVRAQLANSLSATISQPAAVRFPAPLPVTGTPQAAAAPQNNGMEQLRAEIAGLRVEMRQAAVNTGKTARLLDDVIQGGTTVRTTEITP